MHLPFPSASVHRSEDMDVPRMTDSECGHAIDSALGKACNMEVETVIKGVIDAEGSAIVQKKDH